MEQNPRQIYCGWLAVLFLLFESPRSWAACVVTVEELKSYDSLDGKTVSTYKRGDVMRTIEVDGKWARISQTGMSPQWVVWKGNLEGYSCGEPTYGTSDTGDWYHDVIVDRMTDKRSCLIRQRDSEETFVGILFEEASLVVLGIAGEVVPGSEQSFRVDKLPMSQSRGELSGEVALQVVRQIEAGGKRLLAQYRKWPSGESVILEYTLAGIVPEIKACRKAMAK